MKRYLTVALVLGVLLWTTALFGSAAELAAEAAASGQSGTGGNTLRLLLQALTPLILIIVTPLLGRLFRKLGIEIDDSVLEPILTRLIEIIMQVEKDPRKRTGIEKKALVAEIARQALPAHDYKLLLKRYGSIETAVQAAYEKSAQSRK